MKFKLQFIATSVLIHSYFAIGMVIAYFEKKERKEAGKFVQMKVKEHQPSVR